MTTGSRRAAVIVNPAKVDVARLRSAVAVEEERGGWQPSRWFETTVDEPGRLAAATALEDEPALVIVAGGDGTVRVVAEELLAAEVPLALIPAGTGNLLARNLGLMAGVEAAVHTAFTGSLRAIDVGFAELESEQEPATNRAFLVMTGIGLDASMATDTNTHLKKRIGWLAYTDPIGRSVLGNKQFPMHYRVDDGPEHTVRAHTVIVGNCGTLTAGLLLLPDAAVDDGLLDVVLFRPKGFWQWLRVGVRLTAGRFLHRTLAGRVILQAGPRLRALQYVQARRLTARFDSPQQIQLDGDGFGPITAVHLTLRPQALRIRVPDPDHTDRPAAGRITVEPDDH